MMTVFTYTKNLFPASMKGFVNESTVCSSMRLLKMKRMIKLQKLTLKKEDEDVTEASNEDHKDDNGICGEDDDDIKDNDDDIIDELNCDNINDEDNLIDRTFLNPSQSDDSDSGTTSAKIVQCYLCTFKTSITTDLSVHQEKTHNWCLMCDKVFPNKKLFKSHNYKVHSKK